MINSVTRRGFLALGCGAAAGLAVPGTGVAVPASGHTTMGPESTEAASYHRLLLKHTRWVETLWDDAPGHYPAGNFYFVNVLGNAVLLTHGSYDAELAGVDRDTLHDHTVRTIDHFAATNFFATDSTWGDGGYEWGGRIFWDATMESYFVAAAKLLWADLGARTCANVDAIAVGGAEYAAGLADTEDPRSGGWSSNGLAGGYRGDSKIEEMGAKSMPLATGLAYFPDHPSAPRWREWLTRWMSNMTGLPSADQGDRTRLEGKPVSWWNEAQNIYDTYIVENHGSYGPIYQESVGAYPGRNAVHFLLAGQSLPDVFHHQPNADGLWRTMRRLGTAAGLSSHPMVADRYHLYGRDVLPTTWRRMGGRDRYVARSERMLIEHLEPYLDYPPVNMLTKFSGEPKYEPEARAEVAMAYLLHTWRGRLHGDVRPVDERKYWNDVAGVTDFGAEVGLLAHQSPASLAMVVTKPGYVKFAFVPEHDDWLFDVAGAAPAFLPSTAITVTDRRSVLYERASDGFDGSATVLRVADGFAGFATLPTGAVVYATSGLPDGDGTLRLHAYDMPGVPGLDGNRTFHGEGGSVTLPADGADGDVDDVTFTPVRARYVRMLGGRPATQWGYSLWSFEVFAPAGANDLAEGRMATASSYDPNFRPEYATDGDPDTRWAVARADRPRRDSWLAVDLGDVHEIGRARLRWDPAYAAEFSIQVSTDGRTWDEAVSVPASHEFPAGWVNVDDRAGFVVRSSVNPIRVTATSMELAAGDVDGRAGMVIEGYPGQRADLTRAAAAGDGPVSEPGRLVASTAADHLSVFNLSGDAVSGAVRMPLRGRATTVFPGSQRLSSGEHTVDVELPAATAGIRPPVFELSTTGATPLDQLDLGLDARDAFVLGVTNNADGTPVSLEVTCVATGASRPVTVPAGKTITVRFAR